MSTNVILLIISSITIIEVIVLFVLITMFSTSSNDIYKLQRKVSNIETSIDLLESRLSCEIDINNMLMDVIEKLNKEYQKSKKKLRRK